MTCVGFAARISSVKAPGIGELVNDLRRGSRWGNCWGNPCGCPTTT